MTNPYSKPKRKKTSVIINGMKVSKSKISYKGTNGKKSTVHLAPDMNPLDIMLPPKEPVTVAQEEI